MPTSWWIVMAFNVGGLVGWAGGYCHGWFAGTNDTERRWSEAVGRADDARRPVQASPLVKYDDEKT